jgi:flagellin-like hook-associated protein FlgL
MKDLEKINENISEINSEIDRLLNEQVVTGMEWLAKFLVDKLQDKSGEIVNLYDKFGNIYKQIEKNPMSVLDDIDGEDINIEDLPMKNEYDPEMSDLMKKMEDAIKKSKRNLEVGSGSIKGSDEEDPIYKKSNKKIYEKITINFRGVNELSVTIGGGQELKQRLSGVIDFDIATIKETSLGYIMNLKNKNFNRDINLLLYARHLNDKPQTNKIQLVYKNGRFVGAPYRVTFEILSIK